MLFRGFRRPPPRAEPASIVIEEITWGVRRRPGFSEFDDPSVHHGLTQHAFVQGLDLRALCGYRPHPRSRGRSVRVAAATESNPACAECTAAIAVCTTSQPSLVPMLADPVREFPAWPLAAPPVAEAAVTVRRAAARGRRGRRARRAPAGRSATSWTTSTASRRRRCWDG
jgi:hypothetical protein